MRTLALVLVVLVALGTASRAAAQSELLVVSYVPGDANARFVVTSTSGSASRDQVTRWVTPSTGSSESASVAVGVLSRSRAAHAQTFTIVGATSACVVRSTEEMTLFAGMTAQGERLVARVLPIAGCAGTVGAYALAGSYRAARVLPLPDDASARARGPTTLPAEAAAVTPRAAVGQPFVFFASAPAAHVWVYCGEHPLTESEGYLDSMVVIGPRAFVAIGSSYFARGAMWRRPLTPLACPSPE